MNNFTALCYLDIPEDPTFVPLVTSERKEHNSCSASSAFRFKGIQDYLKCYRSGVVTPGQVAKNIIAALKEVGKVDPNLQAIAQWNEEEIIKVPYHHRSGTVYLGTKPETEDAIVTKKLWEAGAIIIGVSNMHELGIGTTECNPNRHHGTTRNPYKPQHFTGGSSSGLAAAVAAGLCPLAIGTGGGGSVRIPASFCGIVGLKGKLAAESKHGFPERHIFKGTACCAPAIYESDLLTGCSDIQTILRTMRYMQLANLTGIPALVVPVGFQGFPSAFR